jgi:hypothetical protein
VSRCRRFWSKNGCTYGGCHGIIGELDTHMDMKGPAHASPLLPGKGSAVGPQYSTLMYSGSDESGTSQSNFQLSGCTYTSHH